MTSSLTSWPSRSLGGRMQILGWALGRQLECWVVGAVVGMRRSIPFTPSRNMTRVKSSLPTQTVGFKIAVTCSARRRCPLRNAPWFCKASLEESHQFRETVCRL